MPKHEKIKDLPRYKTIVGFEKKFKTDYGIMIGKIIKILIKKVENNDFNNK